MSRDCGLTSTLKRGKIVLGIDYHKIGGKKLDIKALREKHGMTQIQLAAKLGVSLSTVRLWEYGAGKPNRENWNKLEEIFDELPFGEE